MKKYSITFSHLLALVLLTCCATLAAVTAKSPKNRVVYLEATDGNCTGVILQTNLVLTCAHCTDKPLTLNGKPARIAKIDQSEDLALLLVQTPVMERINLSECQIADDVFTYGHPMREKTLYFSKGYVMNVQDQMIQVSTIALPGDSGSPLFSADGSLLGLINGRRSSNGYDFPIALTIPAKTIKSFLGW